MRVKPQKDRMAAILTPVLQKMHNHKVTLRTDKYDRTPSENLQQLEHNLRKAGLENNLKV